MKRLFILFVFSIVYCGTLSAQYYGSGTTTVTHKNEYGQTIGTSTSSTSSITGNTTTTHRNVYGQTIGSSTSSTSSITGNTTTVHKDEYGRTIGTTTTSNW